MEIPQTKISELIKSGGKYDIVTYDDAFNQVIDRCGNSQIMIIPIIGQYQIGKSTFLSILLGMDSIKIGNGIEDETMGIVFYGPVNYSDLLSRFGLTSSLKSNIKLIFVDTQGYGGWKSGNGDSGVNNTRLLSSIIPMSQILLLYTNSNDSNVNIQTLKDFFELMKCCFETFNETDFEIMNLIKLHGKIDNIEYNNPTRDKYDRLSEYLRTIQSEKYRNINISKYLPYPNYNNDVDFPQENLLNESFKTGFIFILTDLIQSIEHMSSRLHLDSDRIKAIYHLYASSTGSNYSLELFANQSRKNADMEILQKKINSDIELNIQSALILLDQQIKICEKMPDYPLIKINYDFCNTVNGIFESLNNLVAMYANENQSYSSDLLELYRIKIRNEWYEISTKKITKFLKDVEKSQVNVAVEEISNSLRSVYSSTYCDLASFTKNDENKFNWSSFESDSDDAIQTVLQKYTELGINQNQIFQIEQRCRNIKCDYKIQLMGRLREIVTYNNQRCLQKWSRFVKTMDGFAGKASDVLSDLAESLPYIAECLGWYLEFKNSLNYSQKDSD